MTVTMDTGDNFDRWLRGDTGELLPWIRWDTCDRCHGYAITFLTVGRCYGGTLLVVATADEGGFWTSP